MATLESFETLLKEVVTAKRLSASKMNKLTDIAMNLMENDTQLVSTLYRMHKTLAPSSKIHSLYAFDALSRAARSKTNKLGLTGDINAEKGNFATFLLKIDGVLDGLIQDMVSLPTPEAKEKTQKILDIWTKNATFPPNVLARLAEVAKDSPQKDTINEVLPTDPRAATHTPQTHIGPTQPVPQSPVTADPAHAQALLQALLGTALSSTGGSNLTNGSTLQQIGTNITASALEPNQVVLLQQLVERAKAQNNNGAAVPVPFSPAVASVPTQLPTQAQPSATSSAPYNSPPQGSLGSVPRDEHFGNPRADQQLSRWEEPNRDSSSRRDNDDWHDRERHGWGGGFRGGRGGLPTRGGRSGWRDQDNWDGPPRRRRSRSRSPPRFGGSRGGGSRGGRDIRPYSPPRRPSLMPLESENPSRPIPPGALQKGKDEFGRDIRSASPDVAATSDIPSASLNANPHQNLDAHRADQSSPHPPKATNAPQLAQPSLKGGGLDTVDFTTFDFSSPAAWEALGKSWQVTHGSPPSQEQLMQLVMGGMSQSNAGNSMRQVESRGSTWGNGWGPSQNQQPGKSIPTYESGSNLSSNSWQSKSATWQRGSTNFDYEHGAAPVDTETDAVVLGGGEMPGLGAVGGSPDPNDGSGNGGMKRVGDGWVWQPS